MKYAEMKKSHIQGSAIARKFLTKLGTAEIRKTEKIGCDFEFAFGKDNSKVATVRTIVNPNKSENIFVETYVTRMAANGDGRDLQQYLGNIYVCPANFFFFLTGTKLCIIPATKFRMWVDRYAHTFQTASEIYWWNQQEIHRHGVLIPIERVRTEFAKGNPGCSIYELKNDPTSDTEIDFIQEL